MRYCDPIPVSRMHIAGVTPVAAYRNEVRECSFRTPVAGNGLIPSFGDERRRRLERVSADPQHVEPRRAVVVREPFRCSRVEEQRPRGRAPDGGRVLEDAPHPLVRLERLALDDPDRGQLPHQLGVRAAGGLVLHHLVHQLEEAEVARRHRVERLPAPLHERRLGNLRRWIGLHLPPSSSVATLVPSRPARRGRASSCS